ncbi:hypothetical protein [Szabonella alba]|uniref:Uncharacterized protein n=1 Tax=Szabonella alba TaxID=2804194 RepID=A0A8K0XYV9_9RHOB|nr:hypothetical protein [Szabonella alba]MBL4916156.1 hypothetical protein [Szabonella alba]
MNTKPIRSPAYPSMSLGDAISAVGKIEAQYRSSPVDRENGAKLIGYSSLSGPANKALAALASFGLVERAGKGMMKVTTRARMILHARTEQERVDALRQAATEPQLFKDIRERFSDIEMPPEDGVRTYLNREGFNPTAVGPAAKAFLATMRYIEEQGASESHGRAAPTVAETILPDDRFGGAAIGDLVQWESGGALQFETPRRVRWVSDDGAWLAVEGSETGIPMDQVTIESVAKTSPPRVSPPPEVRPEVAAEKGFSEWFRAKVGADKLVTINFKGEGEIGPKEIQKMILVLEAQKSALED